MDLAEDGEAGRIDLQVQSTSLDRLLQRYDSFLLLPQKERLPYLHIVVYVL